MGKTFAFGHFDSENHCNFSSFDVERNYLAYVKEAISWTGLKRSGF